MLLENILPFAHSLLRQALKAGGRALDATAGNGHDTLLLAQSVGETGRVWAFDVQSKALVQTQGRLKENGVDGRVALIHDGHENLLSYIDEPLDAAVFNFGWLPGGNKSCTTEAASSIRALTDTLGLLKEGGLAVAVLYHGKSFLRKLCRRKLLPCYAMALSTAAMRRPICWQLKSCVRNRCLR